MTRQTSCFCSVNSTQADTRRCLKVDLINIGLYFWVNFGNGETLLSPHFHNTTVANVFNKHVV